MSSKSNKRRNFSSSPLTQIFQNIFEDNLNISDTNYEITYKIGNTNNSNASTPPISRAAKTSDGYFCNIIVAFDEDYMNNATDLSIARTAIHETLHATLIYMLETGDLNLINSDPSYVDLLYEYYNLITGQPNNNALEQHAFMSNLVDDIATSLSQFGSDQGYSIPFSFYQKLSWGGLTTTQTFLTFYPEYLQNGNVNPEYRNIINIITSEQNNSSDLLDSNGDIIVPKEHQPNSQPPCN